MMQRNDRGVRAGLVWSVLLAGCAPSGAEGEADALPGRYPNQLTSADETIQFALLARSPLPRSLSSRMSAVARSSRFGAAGEEAGGGVAVPAIEALQWRDVDADGVDDLVATFSRAELLAAGLIDGGSRRLRVDVSVAGHTLMTGSDRVLGPDALVVRIPTPSGPSSVGTLSDFLFDATRDRVKEKGRPLYVRLWYPAASSPAQPADYFPIEQTARAVAASLGTAEDLFDAVHASSIGGARPAALAPAPTLLLSTGSGIPVDAYAALAEDLASHGFIVVGVGHPDGGSGPIAYPDGSVSEDVMLQGLDALDSVEDPEQQLALEEQISSAANFEWARDLLFVLDCMAPEDACGLAPRLREVLSRVDFERIGALGHSFGGSAAVWADLLSARIRASADLDGALWGAPLEQGPDSRVLVLSSDDLTVDFERTQLPRFFAHSRDITYRAQLAGSAHLQLSDVGLLTEQLPALSDALGAIEAQLSSQRVVEIQTAYVRAFFEQELEGRPSALLRAGSAEFPEVTLDIVPAAAP